MNKSKEKGINLVDMCDAFKKILDDFEIEDIVAMEAWSSHIGYREDGKFTIRGFEFINKEKKESNK